MVYPMTIVYYSSYIINDFVNETSLNSFTILTFQTIWHTAISFNTLYIISKENHPYLFVLCAKGY